jgi:hypothetical protein
LAPAQVRVMICFILLPHLVPAQVLMVIHIVPLPRLVPVTLAPEC